MTNRKTPSEKSRRNRLRRLVDTATFAAARGAGTAIGSGVIALAGWLIAAPTAHAAIVSGVIRLILWWVTHS